MTCRYLNTGGMIVDGVTPELKNIIESRTDCSIIRDNVTELELSAQSNSNRDEFNLHAFVNAYHQLYE